MFEDCRLFYVSMNVMISKYVHNTAMFYERFCMYLIRFSYFEIFEFFTINRSVHKRTLAGNGEKPSRQENEGPLLIFVFYF